MRRVFVLFLFLSGVGYGSDISHIGFIDEQIESSWGFGVRVLDATEFEWCRRVYLDVIGRIPTVGELDRHISNKSSSRREELVDRLLGGEYEDEYSRHWTDVWMVLLLGRDGDNDFVSRAGMRQYLRGVFSRNVPYDGFVRELVTAVGSNKNDGDDFNGAVNFLSGKMEAGGVQATVRTAQLFLGLRVQCSQCHDHPFFSSRQSVFWQLNSFFRQAVVLRRYEGTMNVRSVELTDQDFAGEGDNPEEAEVYFDRRNGLKEVAYPVFVDGTEISKSGYLDVSHRRRQLADLIISSPSMPMAMVNRMWAHFLGYGFTRPVDDFDEKNPPSHPELLEGLGVRFRESGFDVKRLIRWIVLSRPYSLSSRGSALGDDPLAGDIPKFSRFYMRQMSAEQVYQSLLVFVGGAEDSNKKDMWLSQFVFAFGTDEGDDTTFFNGSVGQVLSMFNGDMTKVSVERVSRVGVGWRESDKVRFLYRASLSRNPSSLEVARFRSVFLKSDRDLAFQDLWWSLINSNEFILIH